MTLWPIVALAVVIAAWHRAGQWLELRKRDGALSQRIDMLERAVRDNAEATEKRLGPLEMKVL